MAFGMYSDNKIVQEQKGVKLPITTSCPLTRPAENSSWETPSAVSGEGITWQILGLQQSTYQVIVLDIELDTVMSIPVHKHCH